MFFNTVLLNAYLKPAVLQDPFNSQNSRANVSSHDVESLKPKRTRFESRVTLQKFGFVSASKAL